MLVLFFTIIFIAELIIAGQIIALIQKARQNVCQINQTVTDMKPEIERNICDVRIAINTILLRITGVHGFVDKRKEDYKKIFSANFLTKAACFILANDWKKIFFALDVILTIKKLLKIYKTKRL